MQIFSLPYVKTTVLLTTAHSKAVALRPLLSTVSPGGTVSKVGTKKEVIRIICIAG